MCKIILNRIQFGRLIFNNFLAAAALPRDVVATRQAPAALYAPHRRPLALLRVFFAVRSMWEKHTKGWMTLRFTDTAPEHAARWGRKGVWAGNIGNSTDASRL